MQNTVRSLGGIYSDFQIFATPGNHDLYNTSGALYSKTDGSKRVSDALSTMQFALVFAGLGYPEANLTGSDGAINLTEYMPAEYWYGEYTTEYIPSKNAKGLEIHYYNEHLEAVRNMSDGTTSDKLNEYYQIGDVSNALSLSVEIADGNHNDYALMVIDAHDRESADVGAYVRVNAAEYEVLKDKNKQTAHHTLITEQPQKVRLTRQPR